MRRYRINCCHRERTGVAIANEEDSLLFKLSGAQPVSSFMLYLIYDASAPREAVAERPQAGPRGPPKPLHW
jgi:hypothetical protein